jgi:type I restriction-modification system DNA methylase subunit
LKWQPYSAKSHNALTFFSRLALGHFDGKGEPDDANFVFREMFKLLNQGAKRLAEIVNPADALSLIGRVLFFRFLRDRFIITESDTHRIAPQASELLACFDNPENAYTTNQWLDRTFNGDFLPLTDGGSRNFFESMEQPKSAFPDLQAIVRGLEPVGTEGWQTKFLKWADFDFAHIPVGLLSQVYEAFCWEWEKKGSKETSVYYTPRGIAATLVEEAFDGLPNAEDSRVLDPACGAGLFLTLAFRRLYRERWKTERPDTKAIREILEKQLRGFDISNAALKLAALSLYLTAIELDPKPIPPEKLIFKPLNNLVLFNYRRKDDNVDGPVIGSLGTDVDKRFDGQFDIVLSNPPWTSLGGEHQILASQLTSVSRDVIIRRGDAVAASQYQNPDSAPDLPFLWKSTEWTKPGGRIAMVLPSRILLKQEAIPSHARKTMFRLIEVTGIINGANLSDTAVWPSMSQPFLLLFARNSLPKDGQVTRIISPQYDYVLNRKGELRIDSKSAQPVDVEGTFDEPWLWKALTVGTPLDAQVVRRLIGAEGKSLDSYWKKELILDSGTGYTIRPKGIQHDAPFMHELPNLKDIPVGEFIINPSELPKDAPDKIHSGLNQGIYRAPLVLVKQAPGPERTLGWALLSLSDVAYKQNLIGYSGAKHSDGPLLVKYIQLFMHCNIHLYYALLTGPRFGSERRVLDKSDLDNCPVIPLDKLTTQQRKMVASLSKRLVERDRSVFDEIDTFFGKLYGLDELDLEVIRDTLDVCLPYNEFRKRACGNPTDVQCETFRKRLESVIQPFFKVLGKELRVTLWKPSDVFLRPEAPFGFLHIGEMGRALAKPETLFHDVVLKLAEDTGTTLIIQQVEGGLLVGILRQYRYWTPSRARLLGAQIVHQYMSIFETTP